MQVKDKSSAQKVIVIPEGIHAPPKNVNMVKEANSVEATTTVASPLSGAVLHHMGDGHLTFPISGVSSVEPTQSDKKNGDDKGCGDKDKEEGKDGGNIKSAEKIIKPEETVKSAETGAFKNAEGVYHDVMELLADSDVKTFQLLNWGGGPIKIFFGLAVVTNKNAKAWSMLVSLKTFPFSPLPANRCIALQLHIVHAASSGGRKVSAPGLHKLTIEAL